MSPAARTALALGAPVLLRAARDLALLVGDPLHLVQWEDTWNATVARFVGAAGRWDRLLPLR